jgi:hypothetical protein
MALRVKADSSKPGGGFAVLDSDQAIPARMAIEDRSNGLYLGETGGWTKARAFLAVEPINEKSVRVGPAIVDYIPSDTPIALYDEAATLVGNLVWKHIRPSAGSSNGNAVRIGGEGVAASVQGTVTELEQLPGSMPDPETTGDVLPPRPPETPPTPAAVAAPPRGRSALRAVVAAVVLLVGMPALAYLAMQIDSFHDPLVCSPTGALHDSAFVNRLFPCRAKPPEIKIAEAKVPEPQPPDDKPYVAFLECTSGKSGCDAQSCAQTYLGSPKNTQHRDAVERSRADAEKQCRATEDTNRVTTALQKLNECVASAAVCAGENACISRYEDALKVGPFASQFRQIVQKAAESCKLSQEATAFSTFNQCVAQASTCDKPRCADAYLSQFPNGPRSQDVTRIKTSAEAACRSDEDSKANFARLNDCMRSRSNTCEQKACFDHYSPNIRTEPYLSNARQYAQAAADMCSRSQEEAAFATFNQCMLQGSPCDKAKCGEPFIGAYRNSSHVPQVMRATSDAARVCATPTVSPEEATRRFISRVYELTMSATGGQDLSSLYAPNVNFYGTQTPRDQIIDEKTKLLARWNNRKFYLQPDAITTSCDSGGSFCRATGRVKFDFYSDLLGRASRGVTTFDYTITDVLRSPRISAEAGKVEH